MYASLAVIISYSDAGRDAARDAARCYRDAIVTFKELRQSRSSSHRLQSLLDTKLGGFPAQIGNTSFPCQIRDFNTFSLSELVSTGLSVSEVVC